MPYATASDMTARFDTAELIQLSDEAAAGVIGAAALEKVLGEADNLVNSYIGNVYALPLAQVPPLLVDLACDIARYRLYKTAAPEAVDVRYKDAVKLLERVSTGKATLGNVGAPLPAKPAAILVSTNERLFSRDSMGGF